MCGDDVVELHRDRAPEAPQHECAEEQAADDVFADQDSGVRMGGWC
jgi:hypothetical protein